MRAAPGFAPRPIARLSRRIDIAKTLFTASPKVAENGELRVNLGAVDPSSSGSPRIGQVGASVRSDRGLDRRRPNGRICLPI
jgi:hypothetical protein